MKKFRELKPSELRWQCDPKLLKFKSTHELTICEGIIGQPRAIEAIKLGLNVKYPGYNIFVTGPVGTGRTTAITKLLDELKGKKDELKDLLYVNNFKNPDTPSLLVLNAGQGREFRDLMEKLVTNLRLSIPQVFNGEEYQKRRQKIINKYEEKNKNFLNDFEKGIEQQGFKVVQVQTGPFMRPAILPIIDGKPTYLEEIDGLIKQGKLTQEQYEKMRIKIVELEENLATIYTKVRELQDQANDEINKLNEWTVRPIVEHMVSEIKTKIPDPKVQAYLDDVLAAVVANLNRFIRKEAVEDEFREFKINLMVDNSETKTIPIIFETTPSFKNLFGTIERYSPGPGLFVSDFLNIKAGAFLRAHGGYLVINALDALVEPWVWQTLKRALRNGIIDIQTFDPFYLFSTSALKPEPITADVKVIMIGNEWLYFMLFYQDEDFKTIFKVKADFDTVMGRNGDNINQYASFIKSICQGEGLLPFTKDAVAEIIEYGVRIGGRKDKLTTRFHLIADIIREADYWARQDQAKEVDAESIDKAVQGWRRRLNTYEDKIQEMIDQDVLMIETRGKAVGQINGLSVYQLGDYAFGRPTKITAKISLGRAGIINIEREANLAGRTFNKGVLIISGFLRSRYAQNHPMTVDATLGFEQSYSEIDGDSASCAEIYAILSALSGIPINQSIAVTGSVNQNGEVQPIGGVNEKIEGFYEVCKVRGLTGNQGVIIPDSNVNDLMLRQEVVDKVDRKKFHVWAVKNIDEGIEILTGLKAGKKIRRGFEKGSINDLVEKKLSDYAEKMRAAGKESK
jgi:ATP-dependent Lon protease